MNKKEEIVAMYQGFREYIKSIDVEQLKEECTDEELQEIIQNASRMRFRNLKAELRKSLEKTGYHYPIIEKLYFLTKSERNKLDEFLAGFPVGDFLVGFEGIFPNEDDQKAISHGYGIEELSKGTSIFIVRSAGGRCQNFLRQAKN